MFETLRQSLRIGIVTVDHPESPSGLSGRARGKPEVDWANLRDARPASAVCPTGALSHEDASGHRTVRLDLAKCTFCGLCADADPAIRMTSVTACATRHRRDLTTTASYSLGADGRHERLLSPPELSQGELSSSERDALDAIGRQIDARAVQMFGRSLHIREVDAGSCNGCEVEINGLNSPVYDIERFGVHFVASPRHADLLLVTGPVTRNMEFALRKTYDATPEPRVVVAVGACGCSGGIFGRNYATCGSVDSVIPVDVYIPGCPPNPHALLHGILLAMGRASERR